jgi:hypothetical protein
MRSVDRRLKAIFGVLVLGAAAFVVGGVTAPTTADAGSCLTGSNYLNFTKPSGDTRYPRSGYLTTTSKCRDINLSESLYKDSSGTVRAIKVCFKTAGCQDHWTNVKESGNWYEVATDVKDGTEYYFKFYTTGVWYGVVAD